MRPLFPRFVGRVVFRVLIGAAAGGFAYLVYAYLMLPDVRPLRTVNPSTTAFMELRADQARSQGRAPRHTQHWVSYAHISQHLTRAVIVAEDDAFWQHEGVDLDQLQESIETDWRRGQFVRGGSTITQQLAKNLYLSPSRNPMRKLRELIIARRLEAELKKARIFELYLNVIEWGDGIYGAEAAARTYFHTSAAALGPSESALLAAAIINPRRYDPSHPNARLIARQQLILKRMGSVQPPPVETVSAPEGLVPENGPPDSAITPDVVPVEPNLPAGVEPANAAPDSPPPDHDAPDQNPTKART